MQDEKVNKKYLDILKWLHDTEEEAVLWESEYQKICQDNAPFFAEYPSIAENEWYRTTSVAAVQFQLGVL